MSDDTLNGIQHRNHAFMQRITNLFLWFIGTVSIIISLFFFADIFVHAFSEAINFEGYPTNGAFQLLNPLRRLAAGQIAGHDFQFFHGLGVIFIHYPLYIIFGKNLFASEMSRWIMSPLLFMLTNIVLIYALTKRWSIAFFTSLGFVALTEKTFYILYAPANSLQGIRSTFPFIAAAIMIIFPKSTFAKKIQLWFTKRRIVHYYPWLTRISFYECSAGLLLALSFFFGTEHGIAACLSFGVTYLFFYSQKSFAQRITGSFWIFASFILSLLSIYGIVSGYDLLNPLKYALIDVPKDQFWYFGAPPNDFLTTFSGFFNDIYIKYTLLLGVVSIVFTIVIHFKKYFAESFIVLFLLFYGLFSNIPLLGYYASSYTVPFARVIAMVIIWILFRVLPTFIHHLSASQKRKISINTILVLMCFLVTPLFLHYTPYFIPNVLTRLDFLTITDQKEKIKHLGSYLLGGWSEAHRVTSEIIGGNTIVNSYPYTDPNWKNGIYKILPAFFLAYSDDFVRNIHVGDTVTFAYSGDRHIVSIQPNNDKWLIIYVDGKNLDWRRDGHPYPIYINKKNQVPTVWSIYAGIFEAENDIFQPSGYDYIIHALGPKRRKYYIDKFQQTKPDFVITMRKGFFKYGEWLWNAHWNFYESLLHNYNAVEKTAHSIIWKKNNEGGWNDQYEWDDTITNIPSGVINLPFPNNDRDEYDIFVVRVTYTLNNTLGWIPFFGQLPRYLITPLGAVSQTAISLPPYETEWSFPIIVHHNQQHPQLQFNTVSIIPGTFMDIHTIQYRKLNISQNNKKYFVDDPLWFDSLSSIKN